MSRFPKVRIIRRNSSSSETYTGFAGIKPHETAKITINGLPQIPKREAYLYLTFSLAKATSWAPVGHVVAWGQVPLSPPASMENLLQLAPPDCRTQVTKSAPNMLSILGSNGSTWGFDLARGILVSWTRSSHPQLNLLTEPFSFGLYRALTDNDRGGPFGQNWQDRRLHQIKTHPITSTWEERSDGVVEITAKARIAPPVLAWSVETETRFRFTGGSVHVKVKAKPQGLLLPDTFSRFGLKAALANVDKVKWFGRGPGESYSDKKMSQAFGNWEDNVDGLFINYEFPQDSGNRTDVRWVEFLGPRPSDAGTVGSSRARPRLLRARFGDLEGSSFQALHYSAQDLDECTHPYELHKRKRADTVIHLDWMHHGLGTGSCGPATLPEYELKTNREFDVEILLD